MDYLFLQGIAVGATVGAIGGVMVGVGLIMLLQIEREDPQSRQDDATFYWWWGHGIDPEMYNGPYKSRDAAYWDAEDDAEPEDSFTILEANKQPTTDDCFDGHDVWEAFGDKNDECWGEDGYPDAPASPLLMELEADLSRTFGSWRQRHRVGQGWRFDQTRNEEEHAWDEDLERRVKL